jgi:hypothetical protein
VLFSCNDILTHPQYCVNIAMQNTELLIAQGNTFREQHQPELALQQYMHAMVGDRSSASALTTTAMC